MVECWILGTRFWEKRAPRFCDLIFVICRLTGGKTGPRVHGPTELQNMNVDGKDIRPIWLHDDEITVRVIDQRRLPHEFVILDITTVDDCIHSIQDMVVRGAPLIGVTAAYGVYLASLTAITQTDPDTFFNNACRRIKAARPTAVNLIWAVDRVTTAVASATDPRERVRKVRIEAARIAEEEAENCRNIGQHGVSLIETLHEQK